MQKLRRIIQKKYKSFMVRPIVNRFKEKCKFRRKTGKYFMIQITQQPRGAIVRFLSERTCILVQPVIISNYLKWHISSRFFMNKIKNENFLSKISVIMSEQFALSNIPQQVLQSIETVESKIVKMMFTCEVCNWKFTEQNYFDEHMLTHSEQLIVAEDEDDVELEEGQYEILYDENEELLNRTIEYQNIEIENLLVKKHNQQKENQADNVCYDCDKNFTRKDFLDYHVQIQHKEFHCEYCPNVSKGEHAFKAHFKAHAEEIDSTNTILKGIDQNLNVSHPKSLKSKLTELVNKVKNDSSHVAKDSNVLKCSYCTYECDKKSDIDEHFSLWHSITTCFKRYDSNPIEKFSCSICNLNFTKRFHLDRHMPVHTHHIYQCSKCQGSFQYKKSFFNHLEAVHSRSEESEFYNHLKLNPHLAVGFRCGFCRFAAKARCRVNEHTYAEHYDEYSAKVDEDTGKKEDDHKTLEELTRKRSSSGQIIKAIPNNISTFKYKCRFCGNAFLTTGKRFRHELENHSSKGIVKKKSSQSNMKQIIDDLTLEVSTTFIACTKCPQIFTVKSMFDNHLSSHH